MLCWFAWIAHNYVELRMSLPGRAGSMAAPVRSLPASCRQAESEGSCGVGAGPITETAAWAPQNWPNQRRVADMDM